MTKGTTSTTIVIFMMIAILNMTIGCSEERSANYAGDAVGSSQLEEGVAPVAEFAAIHADLGAPSDSAEVVLRARTLTRLQPYMSIFQSWGYGYSAEHSFYESGWGTPAGEVDSVQVHFITLAFVPNNGSISHASYISYTESTLGTIVAPYVLSFVEPEPDQGFRMEVEGVWRADYPGEVVSFRSRIPGQMAAEFDINAYLDCVSKGTAAGCATALVLCAASGPAYPACAASGCAGAAIGSAIGCAFAQW